MFFYNVSESLSHHTDSEFWLLLNKGF